MKKVKLPLSKIETRIWHFVLSYFADNKYSPTRREISEELGISTLAQVHKCLRNMQKKGWIKLGGHKWRNIINPKEK